MRIIGDGGHARAIREVLKEYMINWFDDNAVIVAVGDNLARKKEARANSKFVFPTIISSKASVSNGATIGEGTIIMPGAVVRANAIIGRFVILNSSCSVDHDCIIGDYAHIAPGAHLCGHVEVGEGSLVGVGVGIAPLCKIPAWTLVKARRLEMEPLYAV